MNVLVSHPGRQHSHQTALAFHEVGALKNYVVSISFREKSWIGRVVNAMPKSARSSLQAELRKRSFPQISDGLISSYPIHRVASYFVRRVWNRWKPRFGFEQVEEMRFDAWVSKLIKKDPPQLCVAYENAALETFKACKSVGARCILDVASPHWTELERRSVLPGLSENPRWRLSSERKDRELTMADVILVPSELSRTSMIASGVNPSKLALLPYGVDLDTFTPKHTYNHTSPLRIIYVGRIDRSKGIETMLSAALRMRDRGTRVILVGNPPPDADLQERYGSIFEYRGFVHHEELAGVYRSADVLVLPSHTFVDSFGLVVLEAMASGTPVVISNLVGSKDLIEEGKTGLIFPAGEVSALSEHLRTLETNRTVLERIGRAASIRAQAFDWLTYRNRLREIVSGLAEASSTG